MYESRAGCAATAVSENYSITLFDDLGHEIQAALGHRGIRLISLAPVRFGHLVGAQPLRLVERVGHGRDAARIRGLELIDETHDLRQLRRHGRNVFRRDGEAGKPTQLFDVFGVQLEEPAVTQLTFDYTRCLLIVLPVAKVAD